MKDMARVIVLSIFLPIAAQANDFPTQARVEFVLGCMNSHGGQNYDVMYRCICSIDKIADAFEYDEYVEAEAFAQLRSTAGERGGIFRDASRAQELVAKLIEVVGAAEKSCFVKQSAKQPK